MDTTQGNDDTSAHSTTVERTSDCEVVVTRSFDAPASVVFEAWSNPTLFERWWVPKSMGITLQACEMDVRTGGTYRLNFGEGMDFFGRYVEVIASSLIVWTNDEGSVEPGADEGPVTTVTFDEHDGVTRLVMSERYPSKEALDEAGTGSMDAAHETFAQLDELLLELR